MARILLIEDNEDDIELVRRACDRLVPGNRLVVARDGAQALEALGDSNPDFSLILIDLNLPKVSGLDVLRDIRKRPQTRETPVVIISVSRSEPDLLQAFAMGAKDFVIKPIAFEVFSKICRPYLDAPGG